MLILDASVVLPACVAAGGFREFGRQELAAPPLMWSEARSALHEAVWRGELSAEDADGARSRLESCPVASKRPSKLGERTWRLADELGWAKTYDAEYVALADLQGCRLVTLDARLLRGAARLGFVVSPAEL